jgi:spoIIIJ-associated protein
MASDDSVVVSAPSVEEAVIIGLTRLTAVRDEVDIEVLDEGNKGFLGIGSREAKVRLTRRSKNADGTTPLLSSSAAAQSGAPKADTERSQSAPATASVTASKMPETPVPADAAAEGDQQAAAPEKVKAPVEDTAPSEPKAAVNATPSTPGSAKATATSQSRSRAGRRDRASDGLDREGIETVAREIITNLLPGLDVDAAIEWVDGDRPTLWVSVGGKDADALVGPRARNLHALQYLFRALIYHRVDGHYNVVVDADGYRRRRQRSLESMARKRADQAVAQGKVVHLRAMPAHERRLIHIALREDDRVTTESVGRGRDRAVTIVPTGASSARNGS